MTTNDVKIATSDEQMTGYLALPDGVGPHPAVLVLHELFGLNDDIRRIARRFAANGYAALAPDLYSVGPRFRPRCIRKTVRALRSGEGRAFGDIEAARSWLADHADVDGSRVAVAGFCLGGGFAILTAARSDVAAAAGFYGAVPREAQELEGSCPIFAAYGEDDRRFLGQAERLRGHLTQLNVEHEVQIYPNAGHSFMNQASGLPSLFVRFAPVNMGYHEPSSEAAWEQTLNFFTQHIGPTET